MLEKTLLSFIWAHSRRDQILLVLLTLVLFPLQYLTLEIPKRIINDAIGATTPDAVFLGAEMPRTTLLVGLCAAFLVTVLAHGALKMRLNTARGIVAERLLRRLRYTLIGHTLRFPRRYQRQVSDGELVSMVMAEAEPMGGVMGDALATPLMQAGQMATILLFLFMQNLWFGLAAVALIPVQAWLIPRMQARINLLNRKRVRQVRALSAEIGELAGGAATLRQNAGWRHRLARVSQRLATLFEIRLEIYKKKFFMKFANNLIAQLTPFFYFLIGGLLVIDGQLTVGALVAALSAFRDLSSPWNELLSFYTSVQEVSQRYLMVIDRFTPPDLLPDFQAEPDDATVGDAPAGAGAELRGVVLHDDQGRALLTGADLTVAPGTWARLHVRDEELRAAVAQILTRERPLASGIISVAGRDLTGLTQDGLADTIGHVTSAAYIFDGTVEDNVLMPLRRRPSASLSNPALAEARRSGNSGDAAHGDWHPGEAAGATARQAWSDLYRLMTEAGIHRALLSRALDRRLDDPVGAALLGDLLGARADTRQRLRRDGLDRDVQSPDTGDYIDTFTLPENLLGAVSATDGWLDDDTQTRLSGLLQRVDLLEIVRDQASGLAAALIETFGADMTASAVYQRLGLPADILPRLERALQRRARTRAADDRLLLSLVFNIPASEFDRLFRADVKTAVMQSRGAARRQADPALLARFVPLSETDWNPRLTVLENLVFGRVASASQARRGDIGNAVADVLMARSDPTTVIELIRRLPTGLRGADLTPQLVEYITLGQALVKRPALLILDRALASFDDAARNRIFSVLRDLLPGAAVLQLENDPARDGIHDIDLELRDGRIVPAGTGDADAGMPEPPELVRKVQALRRTPLFRDLSRAQLRVLAFSARWLDVPAGTTVFRKNDRPDGAYVVWRGKVELLDRDDTGAVTFSVEPPEGTLVGELGLIRNDPRRLELRTREDATLLRVDAADFLSVLETDPRTSLKLIRNVMGYLDRAG